jgi:hypothetical protein|uniref:Uncharacterized protein n=1 Tax=Fagus sylvatica TaxID=28930 RepID=A0A2N9GJS8_FAGSY
MGPAPRAVDVDLRVPLRVKERDTDYGFDERLMRRCKRRLIADRNFNAARKTRNNSVRMEDAVDVDLRVKEEDTDYGFDERLMKRCKRRRIADRNFNAARKTRNNSVRMEDAVDVDLRVEEEDTDYGIHLSYQIPLHGCTHA